MTSINLVVFFAAAIIFTVCSAENEVDLGPPPAVRLPRCRCFPQDIIDISQSKVPCYPDDQILVREQLNKKAKVRKVPPTLQQAKMIKREMGRFRPRPGFGRPSMGRPPMGRRPFRGPRPGGRPSRYPSAQAPWAAADTDSTPTVSFNMTYVVDDIAHFYMDGVLVTCDSIAPKRRIRVELKDVPCTDLVVRVENESPRCKENGGGGLAVLIEHDGKTYGSVPDDVEHPCMDEDKDDYCFSSVGKNVIPISGKGALMPADNCFPFTPFIGSDMNDCKVTREDKVETCHLAFDMDSDDPDSLVKRPCDPKDWKLPLLAADILPDFPLCEFIAMGRNGGITANPLDGFHKDKVVYGVRFELPFCKN